VFVDQGRDRAHLQQVETVVIHRPLDIDRKTQLITELSNVCPDVGYVPF
jgi:hypothetical protein